MLIFLNYNLFLYNDARLPGRGLPCKVGLILLLNIYVISFFSMATVKLIQAKIICVHLYCRHEETLIAAYLAATN
jgi:hypothetical protein